MCLLTCTGSGTHQHPPGCCFCALLSPPPPTPIHTHYALFEGLPIPGMLSYVPPAPPLSLSIHGHNALTAVLLTPGVSCSS